MESIHAHEVLRMMEGSSYSTISLKEAIISKFGAEQRFNTCSVKELSIDELLDFLTAKGKFKPLDNGFTVDLTKVCKDY